MKKLMKPIRTFFPITRIDDEQRVVEGYAFVNEVVPGEGGIRLKRTAMEAATPEYLRAGTVRAMHQPIAAGKPLDVVWDDKGAYLRAKIVDDAEWNKVKEGVYKGFSISASAITMRGKDVETCEWWDSSLVDRGKDADALFSIWHAAGDDEERECEILEEEPPVTDPPAADPPVVGRSFKDSIPNLQAQDLMSDMSSAFYLFMECVAYDSETPEEVKQNITEFCNYLGQIADGTEGNALRAAMDATVTRFKAAIAQAGTVDVSRLTTVEGENTVLLTRAQTAENDLAIVRGELSSAKERIVKLERMPTPLNAPVRFPEALARTLAQKDEDADPEANALLVEYRGLIESLEKEPDADKRSEGVSRMLGIKHKLGTMGVRV